MRKILLVSLTAVRAETPEGDVRLVHQISGVIGGLETRSLPDRTVDIGEAAALSANEVMMVVPDPALETRRASRGFDPAYETRRGEGVEGLVHGLERHVTQPVADTVSDGVDVQMVAGAHGVEDGEPGGRHPEPGRAELGGGVVRVVRVLHVAHAMPLT
jgi:hypothetical protein